jgi:hypothetical protein
MPYIKTNDATEISYKDRGTGQNIVLVGIRVTIGCYVFDTTRTPASYAVE